MPTKGYFLRKDNFLYLEEVAVGNDMSESEYLNQLIEKERVGVPPKSVEKPEKVVKATNIPELKNHPEIEKFIRKGDGLNTCKKCGSQLPYYKGKCKNC